jgi:HEAT repeat protein
MCRRLPSWIVAVWVVGLFSVPVRAEADPEPSYEGKPLQEWVAQLQSPSAKDRQRAVEALGVLGTQARSALPALVPALKDHDVHVRVAATEALISAGPAAVPLLTGALWSEDDGTRFSAVLALGQIGGPARSATPSLLKRLEDDGIIRLRAAETLGLIGAHDAIPFLTPMLKDPAADARTAAAAALIRLGADANLVIPVLVDLLQEKDPGDRRVAVEQLLTLGREARPAVAALSKALQDENAPVRHGAALALGRIGPGAKDTIAALTAVLKEDKADEVRLAAAEALWRLGRHADVVPVLRKWLAGTTGSRAVLVAELLWRIDQSPEAVAALRRAVEQEKAGVRQKALEVLAGIGPKASPALDAVVPLLKEKGANLRLAAAACVFRCGARARLDAPPLTEALKDDSPWVRLYAAASLWQLRKDRDALRLLTAALKDSKADVRLGAVRILIDMGPDAKEVLPALVEVLGDTDGMVRANAAEAVWKLGKDAKALPALVETLQDKAPSSRSYAATTLGYVMRQEAKPAVPALIQALWDEDTGVRAGAAEALGRIGPPAQAAIPALLTALKTPGEEDHIYSSTAEALGRLGPAAKSAIPALREKLKHPDSYVRINAAKALWHIDQDRAGIGVARAGLEDRRGRVRVYAAEALWFMEKHPQAIPTLVEVLGEDRPDAGVERYMAARALGRIGPPAKAAVPGLLQALSDVNPDVRETAAEALEAIAPGTARRARRP